MEFSDLNWFDISIITIILLSSIFAFLNGFIKTIFSFVTWAGAGTITLLAYPGSYDYLLHHMDNAKLAMAFASLGTFIVSFIVLAVMDGQITDALDRHRWGVVDRTLGFAFGFVRGFIIVLFIFFSMRLGITALHMNDDDSPKWVTSFQRASIYPILDVVLEYTTKLMPDTIQTYVENTIKGAKNVVESAAGGDTGGIPGKELSSNEKLIMKKIVSALPEGVTRSISKGDHETEALSDQDQMIIFKKMFLAYKDAVKNDTIAVSERLLPTEIEQIEKAFELVSPAEDESYTDKNIKQLDRLMNTVE